MTARSRCCAVYRCGLWDPTRGGDRERETGAAGIARMGGRRTDGAPAYSLQYLLRCTFNFACTATCHGTKEVQHVYGAAQLIA